MRRPSAPLPQRVAARLGARIAPNERVLVAVSGGLDSVVLLHLLRFAPEMPRLDLVAGHFDHRMRPDSADDARWVADLAAEWSVPFELGEAHATAVPRSEAGARHARYAWLERAKARTGATWILTAHHADDQAETVLFRVARGTGVAGLRGIPARRGALLRPLLSVWREELEGYAASQGLSHRTDATNADPRFARNRLRLQVIPGLEQAAPGARRALVRLARVAAREERAWRGLVSGAIDQVVVEGSADRVVLARDALLRLPGALRARVLRALVRRFGGALDEAGTGAVIEFTRAGASGRSVELGGGLVMTREFERLALSHPVPSPAERPLGIPGAEPGTGLADIGGRRWSVRWSPSGSAARSGAGPALGEEEESFALARLAFPLQFRARRPGDRIRLSYGSKKLKKLLGELRIPVGDRECVPVLVDASERVLWVPGVARAADGAPGSGEEFLQIGVRDGARA